MTEIDRLHAAARELAETIATRIAKLEPERSIAVQARRLVEVLEQVAELVDEEGRPR